MPGAPFLMWLTTHFQIEFACRAGRHASQYSCVGRKRKRNMSQLVYPHPRGDDYRRQLGDLHCPLANNVAAQYATARTVNYQFAKTHRAPINDCARGRVEA